MMDYEEDDRVFVVDTTIKYNLGSKEEIELYEELSLALELMKNNNFNVVDSKIDNGINFGISTQYPHGLPENIGIMFFNINIKFSVNIKETSKYVYAGERYFVINIKKD
jgi:hypothetical protein